MPHSTRKSVGQYSHFYARRRFHGPVFSRDPPFSETTYIEADQDMNGLA